jgi:hypothetical protein
MISRIVRGGFGLLALLGGISMLLWIIYGVVSPKAAIRLEPISLLGAWIPALFIWAGWTWLHGGIFLRPRKEEGPTYTAELTVSIKMSNPEFGTETERWRILQLKHELEIRLAGLGEIDADEFGGGEGSFFIQTNAPQEAKALVQAFLDSQRPPLKYSFNEAEL